MNTSRNRWRAVLAVLGAVWCSSSSAAAAERGPALNWVRLPGAESCIPPVELAERVETRLGRRVFVRTSDAIVVIEGRVEPAQPLGFSTVLTVSDPDGTVYGTREIALEEADCRKLDDVVTLVIAVTIHHGSGSNGIALPFEIARELDRLFERDSSELDPGTLPPSAAAAPLAEPGSGAPVRTATETQRREDANSRLSWDLRAGIVAASGLQPGFTVGPIAGLRFSIASVGSAALWFVYGVKSSQSADDDERGTLEFSALSGGLTLCAPGWASGTSELAACASAALGNIRVKPRDFAQDFATAEELWVDVGPALIGRTQLVGPAFVQLGLGMPIRLRAPSFEYTRSSGRPERAFEVSRVGLQLELSLSTRF